MERRVRPLHNHIALSNAKFANHIRRRRALAALGLAAACVSAACGPVPDTVEETSGEAWGLQAADAWDGQMTRQSDFNALCAHDNLYPEEARSRTMWSIARYPKTVAMYYSFVSCGDANYEAHFGELFSALDEASKDLLKLPDGSDRPRPKYFMWGSGTSDSAGLWRAPTKYYAPPDKPDNVSIRGICTSSQ